MLYAWKVLYVSYGSSILYKISGIMIGDDYHYYYYYNYYIIIKHLQRKAFSDWLNQDNYALRFNPFPHNDTF